MSHTLPPDVRLAILCEMLKMFLERKIHLFHIGCIATYANSRNGEEKQHYLKMLRDEDKGYKYLNGIDLNNTIDIFERINSFIVELNIQINSTDVSLIDTLRELHTLKQFDVYEKYRNIYREICWSYKVEKTKYIKTPNTSPQTVSVKSPPESNSSVSTLSTNSSVTTIDSDRTINEFSSPVEVMVVS